MNIFLVDDQPPEALAMLQALYSRSAKSARVHLQQVQERGSSKFMESYYVGYGHASIGDCASTTLFIESVSVLAAKAIQDNPLYSGQETSTRYIDFANQGVVIPDCVGNQGKEVVDRLLDFYLTSQDVLRKHIAQKHGLDADSTTSIEAKTLNARVFDVLRAFLPAGIKTQLSWTTNLRQAAENVIRLSSHPSEEVRQVAHAVKSTLSEKYPSSFGHKSLEKNILYLENDSLAVHFPTSFLTQKPEFSYKVIHQDFDRLQSFSKLLQSRPKNCVLPRDAARACRFQFTFPLDYGSFRDLQRHRNGYCPVPLLTTDVGFETWYLDQLPDALRNKAVILLGFVESVVATQKSAKCDSVYLQYITPLGYKVNCDLEYDLSQSLYVSELRSGMTVHPTLRTIANKIASAVIEVLGQNVAIYNDNSADQLDLRRGKQDIIEKVV